MANICIILGASGTGKSSSIRGLEPRETLILNVLRKKLPFKGSNAMYNSDNKNLFNVDDHIGAINLLEACNKNAPHIKNIIIDDKLCA